MSGAPAGSHKAPRRRAVRRVDVEGRDAKGGRHPAVWGIAEETPVEIGFNGRPWVVMLASPRDLEDLAVGLSYTEGIVADPQKIEGVTVHEYREGFTADVAVSPAYLTGRAERFRALEGRTGCGLCGVETLADTVRQLAARPRAMAVDDRAAARAFAELHGRQPLNEATRSVHAAAWCALDGGVREVREDVGRHNALDKLIGALLRATVRPTDGFFAMTSRCSMELVQKAAAFGAPQLATISAPTHRALELAAAAGLSIRCLGPDDTVISFSLEGSRGKG